MSKSINTSSGKWLKVFVMTITIAFTAPFVPAQVTGSSERTGWIMFDDSVATVLELREGQIERLSEIDRRYQEDYARLGADPRSDANYLPLTERRNSDIRTVLDEEQYDVWMRMNDYDYDNSRRRAEPGPADSKMDRRDPQGNIRERDSRSNVGSSTPKTGGSIDR